MAVDDAQPVSLGMLKDILASHAAEAAAETATLREQITALQAENTSLQAVVSAAKATSLSLDNAEMLALLRKHRAEEAFQAKIKP